jgi:hypothetical protein
VARADVSILSGTRSELGGVDVGLANVFERPARPGVLTCLLALPDRDVVLGEGDVVEVGGASYRLVGFEPHRTGTHAAIFRPEPAAPTPAVSATAQPVILHSAPLASALRAATDEILAALGGATPAAVGWNHDSQSVMHREWNGAEFGPTVTERWTAAFDASDSKRVEASVTLEDIRYTPEFPWRVDVSGYWRVGDERASLLVRSDADAKGPEAVLGHVPAAVRPIVERILGGVQSTPSR